MKRVLFLVFIINYFQATSQKDSPLIPLPNHYEEKEGSFLLSKRTLLFSNQKCLANYIEYFNSRLQNQIGFNLADSTKSLKKNFIQLDLKKQEQASSEAYDLSIDQNGILISGDTVGIFYGIQTLLQLIHVQNTDEIKIPCLSIKDEPRFAWRGMHLDVSRHFFSIAFVKRYIDFLAMYKMNSFHWHLTDDQGWRIEIKKYPLLTQLGAYRKGSMVGAYSDSNYDTIQYGGFYTQQEIKEVVAYAQSRYVNIVPEIEMPGHAQAAISAYPYLSCSKLPTPVAKGWGVFENVFCSNDSTIQFMKDVLDEVMNLFPGPYIHIGGDECPKIKWKSCAVCQNNIKTKGLKDEHELQSYFIKQIEAHVNSKGKQIIGWDEILEGGLAPNAAVMSWRGEEGGIAAAKLKHKVVMSPGSHCYFDHYQDSPKNEPIAIGGFTPLEKVYAYNPIPKELTAQEQTYILGAQANVWTEYILSEKHIEYMCMPRMAALAEVLWTQVELKNESHFLKRLQKHFEQLDKMKINYAKALYRVQAELKNNETTKHVQLELAANPSLGQIRYTLDGTGPTANSTPYQKPIILRNSTRIKAALFQDAVMKGRMFEAEYDVNKATNKTIRFKNQPSKYYNKGGAFVLVNGESASLPRINTQWLGWSGDDIELSIDLEYEQNIKQVDIGFLDEEMNWIYLPREVSIFCSSDGSNYTLLQQLKSPQFTNKRSANCRFTETKARYVKIIALNHGKIEAGKPGAGEAAWLFCDEIKIN